MALSLGSLLGCFAAPGAEDAVCQDDPACLDTQVRCQDNQLLVCSSGSDACLHAEWQDCGDATCGVVDGVARCVDGPALDTLVPVVAQAICGTLFRCCGDGHRERYFGSYRYSERLRNAGFEGRLPPDAALSAEDCPALVADMLQVEPLGPWVVAAQAGEVAYDGPAARVCLDALRDAACGDDAWSALTDATCFAHLPPTGGDERRSMFERSRGPGQSCRALSDGVGGAVYGSCDPARAWCCRPDAEDSARCSLVGDSGTCVAVSAQGERCQYFGGDVQVCATGLDCADLSSEGLGQCRSLDGEAALAAGEACYDDASYSLLGSCQDSSCDLFGSGLCEPYHGAGEACAEDSECRSGGCEQGVCIASFCPGVD
ncbi:MAG: hypothetical protein ABIJ09_04845 [Pseudomonadota bacterium]